MYRSMIAGVCLAMIAGCSDAAPRPARTVSPDRPAQPASAVAPAAAQTSTPVVPSPTPITQPVKTDVKIASAGSVVVTRDELVEPLIEAHGLDFLIQLLTLKTAAQEAQLRSIEVSDADIQQEIDQTIHGMFQDAAPEDYDRLLQTFLTQQQISRTQFDILMKTNAYLRKLAQPQVEKLITEDVLHQAFGTMYGETVRVRHIQVSNMHEITEAQRRLAGGEDFAQVAREMSRNTITAPRGGEMTPFSLQMGGLPDSFKQAAFALKVGEVSDAVLADDAYHLIKLEERIAPKAVKYEDLRESVRQHVYDSFMMSSMRHMRNSIRQDILQRIKIDNPTLARQFHDQMHPTPASDEEKQRILRDVQRQQENKTVPDAAVPTTAPAPGEQETETNPTEPVVEPSAAPQITESPKVENVEPAPITPAVTEQAAGAATTQPASATGADE
ncbi:MAG: peptidylprolyl isomerase [Phycisphaerales bacterium]|nr:peptidylprolyl isomerase [Phycisphaerales bacterium]